MISTNLDVGTCFPAAGALPRVPGGPFGCRAPWAPYSEQLGPSRSVKRCRPQRERPFRGCPATCHRVPNVVLVHSGAEWVPCPELSPEGGTVTDHRGERTSPLVQAQARRLAQGPPAEPELGFEPCLVGLSGTRPRPGSGAELWECCPPPRPAGATGLSSPPFLQGGGRELRHVCVCAHDRGGHSHRLRPVSPLVTLPQPGLQGGASHTGQGRGEGSLDGRSFSPEAQKERPGCGQAEGGSGRSRPGSQSAMEWVPSKHRMGAAGTLSCCW